MLDLQRILSHLIERDHSSRNTHRLLYPESYYMEIGEIKKEKVYASPRPPPKISFKDICMEELDSELAGGSEDSQQNQPKSQAQLSSTERPVSEQPPGLLTKEIGKDVLFGCESTNSRTEKLEKELCASVC